MTCSFAIVTEKEMIDKEDRIGFAPLSNPHSLNYC